MDPRDIKTRVSVQFQYRGPHDVKPCDWTQEERLLFEVPAGTPVGSIPIPAVGDTVSLTLTEPGKQLDYRVLTRHHRYVETSFGLLMDVNFVVTDATHWLAPPVAKPEVRPPAARRATWGLAASVVVLSGLSTAALIGLAGERRHAETLVASNRSLSGSVQDLQDQLRMLSGQIQGLNKPDAPAHAPIASAASRRAARPKPARLASSKTRTASRKKTPAYVPERPVYRFQLAESNRYNRVGPISVSVRQVSSKRGSCDLFWKAADGRVQRKHVGLHEAVRVALPDRRHPLELVVDQIGNNSIRGHLNDPSANVAQLASF